MNDCIGWTWLSIVVTLRAVAACGRACFRPFDIAADVVDEWGSKREAMRDKNSEDG